MRIVFWSMVTAVPTGWTRPVERLGELIKGKDERVFHRAHRGG